MPVVEGVAISANSMTDKPLAERIEKAMSAAAAKCYADNERDPVKVRAAMMAARQAVLDG